MRFSIAKLLVAMLLLNVLICLSFAAPPIVGYPLLTLISLIIVPPIILVGVVNTRGPRQAFFLGCMVAGVPHFILSTYAGVMMALSFDSWDWGIDDSTWIMQVMHLGCYFLGMLGGLSGLGAWFLIVGNDATKEASAEKRIPKEDFGLPDLPDASFAPEESMEGVSRPLARTPK